MATKSRRAISRWPESAWAAYWHVTGVGIPIFLCVVTGIWFTWGGIVDMRAFFRRWRRGETAADVAAPHPPRTDGSVDLVDQAQAFKMLSVEDVMTPRADIVAVEIACPFNELLARFLEAEHTRMPIYRGNLDDPVGQVHVKDVFKMLVDEDIPVVGEAMPRDQADRLGAEREFGHRYPDVVSVYTIGELSKEFCGGPHVPSTGAVGRFRILKQESSGAGVRRIRATVG